MIDIANVGIQLDSVVGLLKKELTFHTICRQLAYERIIAAKVKEQNIVVTDDEVQAAADQIRRELRLESVKKTQAWLQEHMVTAEEWEAGIRLKLETQKLADVMFGAAAERQFSQRRLDYESVLLYKLVVEDSSLAQELAYQIEEEETSFFEAAHLYDSDPRRRHCCGYEGEVSRWTLEPDIAASVFGAPARTVIGPISLAQGYGLFYVDEFIEPVLTVEVRQEICDRLFHEWLEGQLRGQLNGQLLAK